MMSQKKDNNSFNQTREQLRFFYVYQTFYFLPSW